MIWADERKYLSYIKKEKKREYGNKEEKKVF